MFTDDIYEADVFSSIEEDDYPTKKVRKRTTVKPVHTKARHTKKEYKVSNEVLEMQERYNTLIANKDANKDDWQKFYLSIEKFIMKHTYKVNFGHFVDKSSDLWGYLSYILLESIIPKKNSDGTYSCWYVDPIKGKIRKGYDSTQTNIGNYLLNKIKWTVIEFNQIDSTFTSYCTDMDLDPIPDSDDKIEQLIEDSILPELPYMIPVIGQTDNFKKELISLCNLRTY